MTVERPLRLNFQATPERIARLDEEKAFQNLASSRKRDPQQKAAEEAAGREEQAAYQGDPGGHAGNVIQEPR